MTDEERRVEALKMAMSYVNSRNKITAESSNTIKEYFTSKSVVNIAEEFEFYIRMGKPLY